MKPVEKTPYRSPVNKGASDPRLCAEMYGRQETPFVSKTALGCDYTESGSHRRDRKENANLPPRFANKD